MDRGQGVAGSFVFAACVIVPKGAVAVMVRLLLLGVWALVGVLGMVVVVVRMVVMVVVVVVVGMDVMRMTSSGRKGRRNRTIGRGSGTTNVSLPSI
jgi:hypothetical protein